MKKRALLYLSDNQKITEFASKLSELGFELIAHGETSDILKENGIDVISLGEMFGETGPDGKVNVASNRVMCGITAKRSDLEQIAYLKEQEIEPVDIVAVNLERFDALMKKASVEGVSALSYVDNSKFSLINASAGNSEDVAVLVSSSDYDKVIEEITLSGEVSADSRMYLASKAYSYVCHYQTLINDYMRTKTASDIYPEFLTYTFEKSKELSFGENAYQTAALYHECVKEGNSLSKIDSVYGENSESYGTISDLSFAYSIIKQFKEPAAIAVKREIICGAGTGIDAYDASIKAFRAEGINMAGGTLAFNANVDRKTAYEIIKYSFETVLMPSVDEDALAVLSEKQGLKVIVLNEEIPEVYSNLHIMKKVIGGMLLQSTDVKPFNINELLCVTTKAPDETELGDIVFGFSCVKKSKSVSVALVKEGQVVGFGQGQLDLNKAFKTAADTANDKIRGCVMVTDDVITNPEFIYSLAELGVSALLQAGGALNTQEIIDACNEKEMAMMITNITHYKN